MSSLGLVEEEEASPLTLEVLKAGDSTTSTALISLLKSNETFKAFADKEGAAIMSVSLLARAMSYAFGPVVWSHPLCPAPDPRPGAIGLVAHADGAVPALEACGPGGGLGQRRAARLF